MAQWADGRVRSPPCRAVRLARDAAAVLARGEVRSLAAPVARADARRARPRSRDPGGGARRARGPPRADRGRARARRRDRARDPPRRDGAHPRPRRGRSGGGPAPAPRGDLVLRHRQRRPRHPAPAPPTWSSPRGTATAAALARFARTNRALPCLGHTHFQPAQPTTVGKRACLWLADLLADLERLEAERGRLLLRGAKGTTGTQASFLQLLGDGAKVRELDRRVAAAFGFPGTYPVTGQTSPRKPEFYLLACLSGLAQSAHKFAGDIRLLARLKEIEEPFGRGPGRFLGDAVQAQPDALRADDGARAPPHHRSSRTRRGPRPRSGWSARSTTRRTAASRSPRRSSPPTRSCCSGARRRRPRGPPRDGAPQPRGGAAVHGERGDPAGGRGPRRRPPGAARTPARALRPRPAAASRTAARRTHCSSSSRPTRRSPSTASRLAALLDPARFIGRAPEQVDEFLADVAEPWIASHTATPDGDEEPQV